MRSTVVRTLKVSCVITPVRTLIIHSHWLMRDDPTGCFWFQAALTFMVPCCVFTFSSTIGGREDHRRMEQADKLSMHAPTPCTPLDFLVSFSIG